MEQLLRDLYKCPWGKDECLKRIVVALRSQIGNAVWTRSHVAFLDEALRLVRGRYVVDESAVREVMSLVTRHGLDKYRGTISEPAVRKRYKIVEVDPE